MREIRDTISSKNLSTLIHFLTYYSRLNSSRKRNVCLSLSPLLDFRYTQSDPANVRSSGPKQRRVTFISISAVAPTQRIGLGGTFSVVNQKWCSVYNVPAANSITLAWLAPTVSRCCDPTAHSSHTNRASQY